MVFPFADEVKIRIKPYGVDVIRDSLRFGVGEEGVPALMLLFVNDGNIARSCLASTRSWATMMFGIVHTSSFSVFKRKQVRSARPRSLVMVCEDGTN